MTDPAERIPETTQDTPETAAPEALAQELEQLRRRERERALLDDARESLRTRGLSEELAPFLTGEDERATARNVAAFERAFSAAVGAEVLRRTPRAAPEDLGGTAPPPPAWGAAAVSGFLKKA